MRSRRPGPPWRSSPARRGTSRRWREHAARAVPGAQRRRDGRGLQRSGGRCHGGRMGRRRRVDLQRRDLTDRGRPAPDRRLGVAPGPRGEPHRRVPRRPGRGPGDGRGRAADLHRLGAGGAAAQGALPPTAPRRPAWSAWPRASPWTWPRPGSPSTSSPRGGSNRRWPTAWKSNPELSAAITGHTALQAVGGTDRPGRGVPVPGLRRVRVHHRYGAQRRRRVPSGMTATATGGGHHRCRRGARGRACRTSWRGSPTPISC